MRLSQRARIHPLSHFNEYARFLNFSHLFKTLFLRDAYLFQACNAARKYPLFLLSVAEAAAVLDGVTEFVARKLEAKFTAWKARHAQRAQNALQASDAGADNSGAP